MEMRQTVKWPASTSLMSSFGQFLHVCKSPTYTHCKRVLKRSTCLFFTLYHLTWSKLSMLFAWSNGETSFVSSLNLSTVFFCFYCTGKCSGRTLHVVERATQHDCLGTRSNATNVSFAARQRIQWLFPWISEHVFSKLFWVTFF